MGGGGGLIARYFVVFVFSFIFVVVVCFVLFCLFVLLVQLCFAVV